MVSRKWAASLCWALGAGAAAGASIGKDIKKLVGHVAIWAKKLIIEMANIELQMPVLSSRDKKKM